MKERRLAGAVEAHNHMDFSLVYSQVDSMKEFFLAY